MAVDAKQRQEVEQSAELKSDMASYDVDSDDQVMCCCCVLGGQCEGWGLRWAVWRKADASQGVQYNSVDCNDSLAHLQADRIGVGESDEENSDDDEDEDSLDNEISSLRATDSEDG